MRSRLLIPLLSVFLFAAVARGQSADVNKDGKVNAADLSVLLSQWDKSVPLPALPGVTASAPAPISVHPSQQILNGPGFFVEISQARFVSASNPRGWKWPEGQLVAARGWMSLLTQMELASKAGYTSVWLWEPTGQPPGAGGCMAWASPRTAADGWTAPMRDDFDDFCRFCSDHLHLSVIVYSGCAQAINAGTTLKPNIRDTVRADIPVIVADFAWFAEQGVKGIGLDALSILQDKDPTLTADLVRAVRADPRTRDLLMACEGWPYSGDAKQQPIVQQHCVSLDMLSGGSSVSDAKFKAFIERVNLAAELSRVPQRRGAWVIHGSDWTPEQLARAYELCRAYGMTPIDWRIPLPR